MNSCHLAHAWLPHEPPNGPDSTVRADWERCPAGMPASIGLRPALVAATIGASLVGSSLLGTENGFGSLWLASNASLHLLVAAWLLIRPGGATVGMLSAGALSAFVLVVYGSWAPALAAGEPFSPLVPGAVGKSAMEYTTAAALAVTVGVVLSSSVYAIARGPGIRVDHRPVVLSSRWWPGVLLMEAIGLCFFVAYNVSSHQPLVSLALFRPSRQTSPKAQPQPTTSFSTEGSMCLSARRFTASDFFWLKVYRLRGSALIAGNLFLYTTIGFVYRIVVTMIRLVETSTPNPRVFRGAGARLK